MCVNGEAPTLTRRVIRVNSEHQLVGEVELGGDRISIHQLVLVVLIHHFGWINLPSLNDSLRMLYAVFHVFSPGKLGHDPELSINDSLNQLFSLTFIGYPQDHRLGFWGFDLGKLTQGVPSLGSCSCVLSLVAWNELQLLWVNQCLEECELRVDLSHPRTLLVLLYCFFFIRGGYN